VFTNKSAIVINRTRLSAIRFHSVTSRMAKNASRSSPHTTRAAPGDSQVNGSAAIATMGK
jgi:hypothetical protein